MNLVRLLCFLMVLVPAVQLRGQLFVFITDDPFGVPLQFNSDSVQQKHIRTINAAYQYKPDNQIIQDRGVQEEYQFDSLGRMTRYMRTRIAGRKTEVIEHPAVYRRGKRVARAWTETKTAFVHDSIFVYYRYDSVQRLAWRRMCDGDYYNTWYYEYNLDGTISRQTHCRETNLTLSHTDFRLGVQTILSQEVFGYERFNATQTKQRCLNDEGKVYKETMLNFDASGRLIDERQAFVVGSIRNQIKYVYDTQGRLKERIYTSNASQDLIEKSVLEYDSVGRTAALKFYRNEVLREEFSYLYNAETPGAYAWVNRRHQEAGIDIVKLSYVLY
jgi:YD repeat-containing protein